MATKKTTSTRQTKKTAAKQPTTKKTAPRRSDASDQPRKGTDAPRSAQKPNKTMSGPAAAASAAQQLLQLTGRDVEGVTGLQRTDDGWRVQVDVVEVRRIPDTTDVLALYELDVDTDGDLAGYRRLRRFTRGTPGEE